MNLFNISFHNTCVTDTKLAWRVIKSFIIQHTCVHTFKLCACIHDLELKCLCDHELWTQNYYYLNINVAIWFDIPSSDFVLKWSEVKWVTVKFLWTKVPCTLGWPYSEGTWLYCDYFIWCVSCAVVVLTGFVMCGCVYVGFVMCECVFVSGGFVMCGCVYVWVL
jgi:hypothetical protein